MKPLYLELSAWGSYPQLNYVDFTQYHQGEVFLITGPTGSGKTTIFDGITYALYGETSGDMRGQSKDQLRSDFASPETKTYVKLQFSHKGKEYEVKRNPRYERQKLRGEGTTPEKEEAALYEEGVLLCSGISVVNEKIREILSIDYKQFKQLSMLAQGEFMNLLSASSKDRVAILRSIFHTQIYDSIRSLSGQRAKVLRDEIEELNHKMQEAVGWMEDENVREAAQLCDFKQILNVLNVLEKELKQQQKENAAKLQKATNTFQQLEQKKVNLEKQQKELNESQNRRNELEEEMKIISQKMKIVIGNQKSLENSRTQIEKQQKRKMSLEETFRKTQEGKAILDEKNDAKIQYDRQQTRWAASKYKEWKEKQNALKSLEQAILHDKQTLNDIKDRYTALDKDLVNAKKELAQMQSDYFAANVGMLAEKLVEGKPCPVCGSTTHPKKAETTANAISKEKVDNQSKKVSQIDRDFAKVMKELVDMKSQVSAKEENYKKQKEELPKQPEWMEEWRSLLPVIEDVQTEEEKTKECHRVWTVAQGKWDGLPEDVRNVLLTKDTLEEEYKQIKENIETYEKQKQLQEKEKEETSAKKTKMQTLIDAEEKRLKLLQIQIPKPEDVEKLQEDSKNISDEKNQLEEQKESLLVKGNQISNSKKSLEGKLAQKDELERTYGIVGDVDRLLNGNNSLRLTLEQFILAEYFQDILRAANLRFSKMTNGRYEMYRQKVVSDGRKKDHLEVEVMDYYTGKKRSIKTLSGGESFKAALCLSLGLSDIIQQNVGGIEIDILFVDEGFGALDEESLEQAIDTLISLAGEHRMIGIISHVGELKNRIDRQIVVSKEKEGSRILHKH